MVSILEREHDRNLVLTCANLIEFYLDPYYAASPIESHYVLASFGIPLSSLPVTILGTIKTEDHCQWMRQRSCTELVLGDVNEIQNAISAVYSCSTERESAPKPRASIARHCLTFSSSSGDALPASLLSPGVVPTPHDVLFGRGKVKDNPGNKLLHKLIGERRVRYEAAEKWEKTVIAEEIVLIFREHSGRFLRPERQGKQLVWSIVGPEIAREKVSHTFRSERSKTPSLCPLSQRRQYREHEADGLPAKRLKFLYH